MWYQSVDVASNVEEFDPSCLGISDLVQSDLRLPLQQCVVLTSVHPAAMSSIFSLCCLVASDFHSDGRSASSRRSPNLQRCGKTA
jgi:hypothetical protein